MKKATRLVSLLLAASMAFGLCPVSAFADYTGGGNIHTTVAVQTTDAENGDDTSRTVTVSDEASFRTAVGAVNAGTYDTIQLVDNITLSQPITLSKSATIQSSGSYTLTVSSNSSYTENFVTVSTGSTLTLTDLSIKVAALVGTKVKSLFLVNGTLDLEGSTSIDCDKFCRAVYVQNGTLNLRGNSQIMNGHTTVGYSGYDMFGGGALLRGTSTMSMEQNSRITSSSCTSSGGGVTIDNTATLIMSGSSSIEKCSADSNGGGVYSNGSLIMNDSSCITGCTSKLTSSSSFAGGLFVSPNGTLKITSSNAGIYNNEAKYASDIRLKSGCTVTLPAPPAKTFQDTQKLIDGWYPDDTGNRYEDTENPASVDTSSWNATQLDQDYGLIAAYRKKIPTHTITLPDNITTITVGEGDAATTKTVDSTTHAVEVEEGQKVTFTVSPADAMLRTHPSSLPSDLLTSNGGGSYSFTVPDANVTILQFNKLKIDPATGAPVTDGTYCSTSLTKTWYGDGWNYNGTTLVINPSATIDFDGSVVKVPVTVGLGTDTSMVATIKNGIFTKALTLRNNSIFEDSLYITSDTPAFSTDGTLNVPAGSTVNGVECSSPVYVAGNVALTIDMPAGTSDKHWEATGEKADGTTETVDLTALPNAGGSVTGSIKFTYGKNSEYSELTLTLADNAQPFTPDASNFDYTEPTGLTDKNTADEVDDAVRGAITAKNGVEMSDVEVIYIDSEGTQLSDAPTAAGDYTFKLKVKAKDGVYTAAEVTNHGAWKFSITSTTVDPTDPTDPTNPDQPADSTGEGVAVVLGTVAVGGAAYLLGTQLWLETNLPGGVIPTSREQLAVLLWQQAGKPEPAPAALYTDISAEAEETQKAARWCVQKGLMRDFAEGTCFKPGDYVFRPQVIKAWCDVQAMC